ncbi:MAG: OmpA family protein [Clostridia bacterium]
MNKPFHAGRLVLAAALALAAGSAAAQVPGYVTHNGSGVVTDSSGNCWKSGGWTPAQAAAPCDAVPRAATAVAPLAAQEAAPAPSTVIEKVNLNSDVLFEFDKAVLRPEGRAKLDELATRLGDARVDRIDVVGHADRIGTEQYNEELSQRRAEAVRDYLAQSARVDQSQVQAEGRGESDPVTGDRCRNMGPERKSNKKLVDCLQPDRRVDVEVLGSREVAGNAGTPSSGASSTR